MRDKERVRILIRPVLSRREAYPLLGWEAGRLMAQLDGILPPAPGILAEGLDASTAEALEARPV